MKAREPIMTGRPRSTAAQDSKSFASISRTWLSTGTIKVDGAMRRLSTNSYGVPGPLRCPKRPLPGKAERNPLSRS